VVIPATDLVEADLPVNIFKDEMGRGATESVAARILKRKPGRVCSSLNRQLTFTMHTTLRINR